MRIAILAQSGPAAGRRIVLRSGHVAQFGRTDWADFAFPEDPSMADIHFAIHCGVNSGMIEALAGDNETTVNGNAIGKVLIHHGDVVHAGSSQFVIQVEDDAKTPDSTDGSPSMGSATMPKNELEVFEIAEYIGLSVDALELAKSTIEPRLFGEILMQSKLLKDAIRWHAHTMTKPNAVRWACKCVQGLMSAEPSPVQQAAYSAAMQWATEPNEDNRERAAGLAEQVNLEGIGGVLAASAGWSGGSLGPSSQPDVPPDDRLTARCVNTALMMAESLGFSTGSSNQLLDFIDQIRDIKAPQTPS